MKICLIAFAISTFLFSAARAQSTFEAGTTKSTFKDSPSDATVSTFDPKEMACEIAKGLNRTTWIEDLNRVRRQVKLIQDGIQNKRSDAASNDYDLRIPGLKYILYWFFSEKDFSDTFAFHNPRNVGSYDLNVWAQLTVVQYSDENRRSGNLIKQANLLSDLRRRAKDDRMLLQLNDDMNTEKEKIEVTFSVFASQLVDWLLQQPEDSVGHRELLRKALSLAGDSYGALGLIASITYTDAYGLPRSRNAVLASKLKPIFRSEISNQDKPGTIYHFWGYLARAVSRPELRSQLALLSWGYERLNQGDKEDHSADMLGIRIARMADQAMQKSIHCY